MTARSGSSSRRSGRLGRCEGREGGSGIGQNVHRIDGVTGKAVIVAAGQSIYALRVSTRSAMGG